MITLPIATGFYQSEILTLAAQSCINWIPIIPLGGAVNERALLDRAGISNFATVTGDNRAAIEFNGTYITLNGTTLSSEDSAGVVTSLGTIDGFGQASITKSEDFVVIVNNVGDGYVYDPSIPSVAKITDSDFVASSTVVFLDGLFVFTQLDGKAFFISAVGDPTSFNALDFSEAELRPDPIVAAFVYGNTLYIAGTETLEPYNNQGGIGFPFIRINKSGLSTGCYARFTPQEVSNSIAFIGGGRNEGAQVFMLTGGQLQKISTPAIDNAIQAFSDDEIGAAFSLVWEQNGQLIAGFTIESNLIDSVTFCYNFNSQQWFEFKSGVDSWRVRSIVFIYGKFLTGDKGKTGFLDKSIHTDFGETIFREKASQPFLSNNGDSYLIRKIEAWFESGVGLTTGQGSNPIVTMDFSDNLGKTWSTETSRSIGKIGDYGRRTQWRRQGFVKRDRVYRFKASDPARFNLMKLTANG